MTCTNCKRDKTIAAKGLCEACYRRHLKTGSFEYQRMGKITPCTVIGCENNSVSHGLCDMHRKRLDRHGSTDERDDARGLKSSHPLAGIWKHFMRYRKPETIDQIWRNDFLQFTIDVGERPSPKHKLYTPDPSVALGPMNFGWRAPFAVKENSEDRKAYMRRWAKADRALRREQYRDQHRQRKYGLAPEDALKMQTEQRGVCAICSKQETNIIRGQTLSLAVDHDHNTGAVRGLLCSACNTGLGLFNDNPDLLRTAIAYLEKNTKQA